MKTVCECVPSISAFMPPRQSSGCTEIGPLQGKVSDACSRAGVPRLELAPGSPAGLVRAQVAGHSALPPERPISEVGGWPENLHF